MFEIKIDPKNLKAIISIENLSNASARGIRQAFYFIGKDLVAEANKLILEKPKHGRLYKIKRLKRIKLHRASAPGETPANLTGSLRKSIDFDVIGKEELQFGSKEIFLNRKGMPPGVIYGGYLEKGTKKMEPRPYLITSIKNKEAAIQTHFEREIKRSLSK